jgi:hypothetical protein
MNISSLCEDAPDFAAYFLAVLEFEAHAIRSDHHTHQGYSG